MGVPKRELAGIPACVGFVYFGILCLGRNGGCPEPGVVALYRGRLRATGSW